MAKVGASAPAGIDDMLEVTSLGSGSCGNAILVRSLQTTLLVDCGVGVGPLIRGLAALGLRLDEIDAVLLTHEHVDHVRELPRFARQKVAIVTTRGTAIAAAVGSDQWFEIRPDKPEPLADFEVTAIDVSHDAAQPCGYHLRCGQSSVTVFTDLGRASSAAAAAIAESDLVILEANHDETMLRNGPYPYHLKRRIASDGGHLSNDASGELLATALAGTTHLPTIWLAHLSETNNRPHVAKKSVQSRLLKSGLTLPVETLPRRGVSATWTPKSAAHRVAQLTLGL
jgi:phosphoribosyl 1,2-cyclic phosphodiesterase